MGKYRGECACEEGTKIRQRVIDAFKVNERDAYDLWRNYTQKRNEGMNPKMALFWVIGHTKVSSKSMDYFTAMALELFTVEYFEKITKEESNNGK